MQRRFPVEPEGLVFAEVALAAGMLIYMLGCYRLLGLVYHLFPVDPRLKRRVRRPAGTWKSIGRKRGAARAAGAGGGGVLVGGRGLGDLAVAGPTGTDVGLFVRGLAHPDPVLADGGGAAAVVGPARLPGSGSGGAHLPTRFICKISYGARRAGSRAGSTAGSFGPGSAGSDGRRGHEFLAARDRRGWLLLLLSLLMIAGAYLMCEQDDPRGLAMVAADGVCVSGLDPSAQGGRRRPRVSAGSGPAVSRRRPGGATALLTPSLVQPRAKASGGR